VIVIDASAGVEIVDGTTGPRLAGQRRCMDEQIHVPHLIDVEVASALRTRVFRGATSTAHAVQALRSMAALPLQRHGHERLIARAWQLRGNISTYDGMYVALAELLGCPLLTADARLAKAPGSLCPIEVLPR